MTNEDPYWFEQTLKGSKRINQREHYLYLCQISAEFELRPENPPYQLYKIRDQDATYQKYIQVVKIGCGGRDEKLLIFQFPELCFPYNKIDQLINDIEGLPNTRLFVIIGLEHLFPEEAKELIEKEKCANEKEYKDLLRNKLHFDDSYHDRKDVFLNMGLLITKIDTNCKFYFITKITDMLDEREVYPNMRFCSGMKKTIFRIPTMNFATLICYDFISYHEEQSSSQLLKNYVRDKFPNFILTHNFVINMTPDLDDSRFRREILNYYFTSPTKFISELSLFTVMAFVNCAPPTLGTKTLEPSKYGKSSLFFLGSRPDQVRGKKLELEVLEASPLSFIDKNGKITIHKGKQILRLLINSNEEYIFHIKLKNIVSGDRDFVDEIELRPLSYYLKLQQQR